MMNCLISNGFLCDRGRRWWRGEQRRRGRIRVGRWFHIAAALILECLKVAQRLALVAEPHAHHIALVADFIGNGADFATCQVAIQIQSNQIECLFLISNNFEITGRVRIGIEVRVEDKKRFGTEESAPFTDFGCDGTDSGTDSTDVVHTCAVLLLLLLLLLLAGVLLFLFGLFQPVLKYRSDLHCAARGYIQFLKPSFKFQLATSLHSFKQVSHYF